MPDLFPAPTGAPAVTTTGWARGPLRPFRHRQYRPLIGAAAFELLGEGVWIIAVVWQVIELGGGPAALSFAVTGYSLGMVLTVLVGGVAADRVPQRRILMTTATVRMVVLALIAALALAGALELWHLAVGGVVLGMAVGFYFPAYSALLPAIVEPEDLLAANGVEGFLRPTLQHAGGPAIASLVVASASPAWALVLVALCQLGCLLTLLLLRPVALRRDPAALGDQPVRAALADLRGGVHYMVTTPWFLATLLFACLMLLVVVGPMEVLIPFVVEGAGGDATDHAWILAAYGVGSAVASLGMSMLRLPRRYLTVMNVMWGVACLPLLVVGLTTSVPAIAVAMFVVGVFLSAPMVIWGTLLQRRVPADLLGRASSLDFFVSLLLVPVSMAVAGPAAEWIGLREVFLVAAFVPIVVAVVAIVGARMPADELEHPLGP
ncbi:MFS transporter [Aeromicrobium sp. 50.2.37]|uniref:MFS transporter n=1 Tax=Aeromicrobium sp. 50.2.37 TaxID=2969305 RepID=UPI00214F9BAB|nr:MFS transporter [Aeromicrobium sp. 50.2.37]MCR4511958.1 MFS transporter [Aeromicrobium sp. 50.2.37]